MVVLVRQAMPGTSPVTPRPDLRVPAVLESETIFEYAARRSGEYPCAFYGIVLSTDAGFPGPDLWTRCQFVFGRSDEGRLVTIGPRPLSLESHTLEDPLILRPGGYERLLSHETFFAFLLSLIRLGYCPTLTLGDDHRFLDEVEGDIHGSGKTAFFADNSVDIETAWKAFLDLTRAAGSGKPLPSTPARLKLLELSDPRVRAVLLHPALAD